MAEGPEIETNELQEAIDELHEERAEREAAEARGAWTKYVGLATAILAVFGALGALESGSLVNEAMIQQLRASDAWNEYQADKTKTHLYTVQANGILDAGVAPSAPGKASSKPHRMKPGDRLAGYLDEIEKENHKTAELSKTAKEREADSERLMEKHHRFAYAVTGIQVAIALGAVSALTKMKWVWGLSLVFGIAGIAMFIQGFL